MKMCFPNEFILKGYPHYNGFSYFLIQITFQVKISERMRSPFNESNLSLHTNKYFKRVVVIIALGFLHVRCHRITKKNILSSGAKLFLTFSVASLIFPRWYGVWSQWISRLRPRYSFPTTSRLMSYHHRNQLLRVLFQKFSQFIEKKKSIIFCFSPPSAKLNATSAAPKD